jgi:hypothetical protein
MMYSKRGAESAWLDACEIAARGTDFMHSGSPEGFAFYTSKHLHRGSEIPKRKGSPTTNPASSCIFLSVSAGSTDCRGVELG